MNSNELKLHICSRTGTDTTCSVNISFKYGMNGQFFVYPIKDEKTLEAI